MMSIKTNRSNTPVRSSRHRTVTTSTNQLRKKSNHIINNMNDQQLQLPNEPHSDSLPLSPQKKKKYLEDRSLYSPPPPTSSYSPSSPAPPPPPSYSAILSADHHNDDSQLSPPSYGNMIEDVPRTTTREAFPLTTTSNQPDLTTLTRKERLAYLQQLAKERIKKKQEEEMIQQK
jgi:hypothetical protein